MYKESSSLFIAYVLHLEIEVGGSSSSSSSSFSYLFRSVGGSTKSSKHPIHLHSVLHSVRRPVMTKSWKRQPAAPLPPTRPRVYKVNKLNFRDLVQKLTRANEISDHRLQTMAPAPLNVGSPMFHGNVVASPPPLQQPKTPLSAMLERELRSEESSFLALNLSPSSHSWFHVPLLSPGTHAPLGIM